ncbi:low molecular weight phosphotyrosine protein phosphatase [Algoriphagus aestuariicola]|jgi:protein-tyrosine phosphatase|uniref:protein-tyrosine-phosphatase n=1 Tax=Algoriphagus aestuariicola TaxID=1852016 RepID=A0ABS3BYM9_9BACT|nr:low molecular weight protein-tyrosine-phosphatase [Algoriphagus aestuariicola]MBN7802829.1 low molecular weight phosphotyrosine protein phosphatase [Algoriphagus aestuariicola]
MIKVLFVCLGNICRSPLAEAIFNHKIQALGLSRKFKSDSAGTSDYHIGELPDERTIQCAQRKGLKINHRGRQVNRTDFRDFDYIIAMDESNLTNLESLKEKFNFPEKEVYLMRDFVTGWEGMPVPDPYYGGEEGFDEIYHILDASIESFLRKIKEVHQLYV